MTKKTRILGNAEVLGRTSKEISILIKVDNPMYMNYAERIESGLYGITFDAPEKNRTLNQNALLWALIGEICKNENASYSDTWEMYCELLRQAKAKYTYVSVVKDGVDDLARSHGIRAVQTLGTITNEKGVEFVNCRLFLGTSQMNTKEISQVIDKAIEYAENLGIDTNYYRDMR